MTALMLVISSTILSLILLSPGYQLMLLFVCGFFLFFLIKIRSYFLLMMIVLGLFLGVACIWFSVIKKNIPPDCVNIPKTLRGEVIDIPHYQHQHIRFDFLIKNLHCYSRVRLNWYGLAQDIQVGDDWQLRLKINTRDRPLKAGQFDYMRFLKTENIQYQGTVINDQNNRLLQRKKEFSSIDVLRQHISTVIYHAIPNHSLSAILTALTIGSRYLLKPEDWKVFQNTGTSHLIAISGLHVSLVAGLFFFLTQRFWRFSDGIMLWMPAPKISAGIALVAAIHYAILAGMSLPTQRALLMLSIVLLGKMFHRHIFLWYRLLFSFTVILMIWPYAALAMSFWLSFFAVAMLGYLSNARLRMLGGFWVWLRLQMVLFIALFPLNLLFFGRVSFVMIIANLLAIPYVSFIIVPTCLFATAGYFFSPHWEPYLWLGATKCLQPLWWYLEKLAGLPHIIWKHAFLQTKHFVYLLIAVLLFLAPRGFPGKMLAPIFVLPLFFC